MPVGITLPSSANNYERARVLACIDHGFFMLFNDPVIDDLLACFPSEFSREEALQNISSFDLWPPEAKQLKEYEWLTPEHVCEALRKLNLGIEFADDLLEWPEGEFERKALSGMLEWADLNRLVQQLKYKNVSIADTRTIALYRGILELSCSGCDVLMRKPAGWWSEREDGLVKMPEFFLTQAFRRHSCREDSVNARYELGLSCSNSDFLMGWKRGDWCSKELSGEITASDIENLRAVAHAAECASSLEATELDDLCFSDFGDHSSCSRMDFELALAA